MTNMVVQQIIEERSGDLLIEGLANPCHGTPTSPVELFLQHTRQSTHGQDRRHI